MMGYAATYPTGTPTPDMDMYMSPSSMPMPTQNYSMSTVQSAMGSQAVTIADFAFSPQNLSVNVGDTVTWTNQDTANHTVTSTDGGPLASPSLGQGQSYSYTFSLPGTYSYHCSIHPMMTGTVTVIGAAATPTPQPSMSPTMMMGTIQQVYPSPTSLTTLAPTSTPLPQNPTLPVTGPASELALITGFTATGLAAFRLGRRRHKLQNTVHTVDII